MFTKECVAIYNSSEWLSHKQGKKKKGWVEPPVGGMLGYNQSNLRGLSFGERRIKREKIEKQRGVWREGEDETEEEIVYLFLLCT